MVLCRRKDARVCSRAPILALACAGVLTACGDDPVEPVNTTLIGVWNLVGLTDGDRVAMSSGTWVFFEDGLMAMDLEINFPDEGLSYFAATGNFTVTGDEVAFSIRGGSSRWHMEFSGTEVLLTQVSPEPADNTITLDRI